MDRLLERAASLGIETRYTDGFRRPRKVKPKVVSRLVDSMALGRGQPARMLPPTIVIRGGHDRDVQVTAPAGQAVHWEVLSAECIATGSAVSPRLTLPQGLPAGRLRLRVSTAQGDVIEQS